MREQLSQDKWMNYCCLFGNDCSVIIQWHHQLTYAGKRVNELYGILPLCELHHSRAAKYQDELRKTVIARIYHFGAEEEFMHKYPKSALVRMLS